MRYNSTRDKATKISGAQAIAEGIAPDGGLYVPESIPGLRDIGPLLGMDYQSRAAYVMGLFLDEFTPAELLEFSRQAYAGNFDAPEIAPLRKIDDATHMLELWHGPTSAFKDMALQVMPRLLTAALKKTGEEREVCILVATSGDTGKAALEGFRDVPGTRIVVFYPRDGVSKVQEKQMTTQEGANVFVSAVRGNFDDTQTGVKNIFADREFAKTLDGRGFFLSSANSINWGRLLPQIAYYVSAYCDFINSGGGKPGDFINFCVPTGNFGNILAAWYAKQMGLPVNKLICASNANNVLTEFIDTGIYDRNREFYLTLSPSMDILVSSNLERLLYNCAARSGIADGDKLVAGYMKSLASDGRYEADSRIKEMISSDFTAGYCGDEETKEQIGETFRNKGYLLDTHTAVALRVLGDYRKRTGDVTPTICVSTASPYKFADSVLSALGAEVPPTGAAQIARLTERSGVPSPAPLRDIDSRELRFGGWVEQEDMQEAVDEFLK